MVLCLLCWVVMEGMLGLGGWCSVVLEWVLSDAYVWFWVVGWLVWRDWALSRRGVRGCWLVWVWVAVVVRCCVG